MLGGGLVARARRRSSAARRLRAPRAAKEDGSVGVERGERWRRRAAWRRRAGAELQRADSRRPGGGRGAEQRVRVSRRRRQHGGVARAPPLPPCPCPSAARVTPPAVRDRLRAELHAAVAGARRRAPSSTCGLQCRSRPARLRAPRAAFLTSAVSTYSAELMSACRLRRRFNTRAPRRTRRGRTAATARRLAARAGSHRRCRGSKAWTSVPPGGTPSPRPPTSATIRWATMAPPSPVRSDSITAAAPACAHASPNASGLPRRNPLVRRRHPRFPLPPAPPAPSTSAAPPTPDRTPAVRQAAAAARR